MITYHGSVEPPPHLGHRDLQESSDNLHDSHRPLPRCFSSFFREKVGMIIDKDKPGHSDLSGCYSFLQTCLGNFSGNHKLFELS